MMSLPKIREVKKLILTSKTGNIDLQVPAFNWKYLCAALEKRGQDHILLKLKTKGDPKENNIVQLKIKSKIVGFIIPGAALTSTSHKFADDPMFGPFALIALQKIVEKFSKVQQPHIAPQSLNELVESSSYYCIFNSQICKVNSAEAFLDKFFPHLLNAGFVYGEKADENPTGALIEYTGEHKIALDKPKTINSFVRKLLFEIIPYEKNPFFSFFYIWQVIEYFMQNEFERRIKNFVSIYDPNLGIVNAKRNLDKLNEIAKEKNRVKSVFLKPDTNLELEIGTLYEKIEEELNTRKENILKNNSKELSSQEENGDNISSNVELDDKEEHFSSKLYYIRNVTFHSFGDIEKNIESMRSLILCLYYYLLEKCHIEN